MKSVSQKRWLFKGLGLAGLLLLVLVPLHAQADMLTFDATIEFSGATAPAGPTPWLSATFDDMNTPGTVRLTLDGSGLTANEFVTGWYFNANIDPSSLGFAHVSGVGSSFTFLGTDCCKADGAGFFDIQINFPAGPPGTRFGPAFAGTSAVFDFTLAGIDINTFDVLSTPSDKGQFHMAAHVQGIGPNDEDSGWVAPGPGSPGPGPGPGGLPVPSTFLLLGVGLVSLGLAHWKKGPRN